MMDVLDDLERKLGPRTPALLRLDPSRPLVFTIDTARSGGQLTGRNSIRLGPPLTFGVEEFFRHFVVHELGHYVAVASGLMDLKGRFLGPQGQHWLKSAGWSTNHGWLRPGKTNDPDGAVSDYARTNAGEDFAETFTWLINEGRWAHERATRPSPSRLQAMEAFLGLTE